MATLIDLGLFGVPLFRPPVPLFRPPVFARPLWTWVLTRYADVKAALNDPRLSADRITPFARSRDPGDDNLAALLRLVGLWSVFTDPPTHTRLRGLMNLAFTSRAVERLRPRSRGSSASCSPRWYRSGSIRWWRGSSP